MRGLVANGERLQRRQLGKAGLRLRGESCFGNSKWGIVCKLSLLFSERKSRPRRKEMNEGPRDTVHLVK